MSKAFQYMPPSTVAPLAQGTAHRVLILNSANWEGISRLPYLLRAADCHVDVMAPRQNFIAHSAWVSHLIEAPASLDAMMDCLREMFRQPDTGYDWVIVGDDPLLCAISKQRHEAWAAALLPCPPTDSHIDFLISKRDFVLQAADAGLPVPDFRICANHEDLHEAAHALGYPVVLKRNEGFGGLSVQILHGHTDLASVTLTEPVILQSFIAGRVCSAAALFNKGQLVCFFSYLRKRTHGKLGASTAIEFKHFPELSRVLASLGDLSGYHGLCGVDFIEEQDSHRIVLLEQNFRPTLTMLLGKHVGVDLVTALRQQLQGQPANPHMVQNPSVTDTIPLFPSDILRSIDDRDLRGLLRFLLSAKGWASMSWHDTPLLRHNVRYTAQFAAKKLANFVRKTIRPRALPQGNEAARSQYSLRDDVADR